MSGLFIPIPSLLAFKIRLICERACPEMERGGTKGRNKSLFKVRREANFKGRPTISSFAPAPPAAEERETHNFYLLFSSPSHLTFSRTPQKETERKKEGGENDSLRKKGRDRKRSCGGGTGWLLELGWGGGNPSQVGERMEEKEAGKRRSPFHTRWHTFLL